MPETNNKLVTCPPSAGADPTSRRRLQNKHNQRAARQRKLIQDAIQGIQRRPRGRPKVSQPSNSNASNATASAIAPSNTTQVSTGQWSFCNATSTHALALIGCVGDRFLYGVNNGCPTADLLLSLTQLNVLRAMLRNLSCLNLSMESIKDTDRVSLFNLAGPPEGENARLPPGLAPTALQRSTSHHPWIDPFPFPAFRDALLQHDEYYDDVELCNDFIGLCGPSSSGDVGMIVWGDPGDPSGWEMTEKFARKWLWLFLGCRELLMATNYWRELRGEKKLFII